MNTVPELMTRPLDPAKIQQAYPVIQELVGDLTLDGWTAFAAEIVSGRTAPKGEAGIIVAETMGGRIRGLFVYRVERSLDEGRTLVIQHFVLPGLGRTMVAEALYQAARELAATHGCTCIRAEIPPETEWTVGFFQKQGHRVVNWLLSHALKPTFE